MSVVWRRARSDEQKEQRRAALLRAAVRLYESRGIEEVSLNAIAREANSSKANVYRYFESREELFLHLTLDALHGWLETLGNRLRRLAGTGDERAVARAFAETIATHPRFARLSSVLSTVLEQNVSTEGIVRFKQAYLAALGPLHAALGAVFPDLTAEQIQQLLEVSYFLMVGMWPSAHPAPAVREALERPELEAACIDFAPRFEQHLTAAIRGVRQTADSAAAE